MHLYQQKECNTMYKGITDQTIVLVQIHSRLARICFKANRII